MKKASQYVGNRRLLKLAAFLEKLPRKRFNYGSYVGQSWAGAPDLSCGTTACAIGWAATMPEFRKFGLKLVRLGRQSDSSSFGAPRGGSSLADPSAGTSIFSLTECEWDYLFMPGTSLYDDWDDTPRAASPHAEATAKQVARHIRRFVTYREKQKAKAKAKR